MIGHFQSQVELCARSLQGSRPITTARFVQPTAGTHRALPARPYAVELLLPLQQPPESVRAAMIRR